MAAWSNLRLPVRLVSAVVVSFSSAAILTSPDWRTAPELRGEKDAGRDLANSRMRFLRYGLPTGSEPLVRNLLWNRYQAELEIVAGCAVTRELADYARGYNRVALQEAKNKFGRDIYSQTMVEADLKIE